MEEKIKAKLLAGKAAKKEAASKPDGNKASSKPDAEKASSKPDAKKATSKPVKKTIAKLLGYPGTSKQPPLHLEKCTVFSQPPQWRVQKVGEKGDKAFSFKVQEPREVWKRLKAYVESL